MGKKKDPNSTAVMARRAPTVVEADSPEVALHRTLDFFPTPPWATRAGAEILRTIDPACRVVREPACGEMHMVGPLEEFFDVLPSDVHAHTPNVPVIDWLDDGAWPAEPDCDWVMTNPPFGIADEFVKRGLRRARHGVALLLRLAFLEGAERYKLMSGDNALTLLAPFSERVPMVLGRWDVTASSATAYAWFFWMKDAAPLPLHLIKPGTRERLWLRDDAERYGWKPDAPLLDWLTLLEAREALA